MVLTVEVIKKEKKFIAKCKELDIYSYGTSSDKAVKRLKKIIAFYVQSAGEYLDEDTKIKKDFAIQEKYIN